MKLLSILDKFIRKAKPEWKAMHEIADKYLPSLEQVYLDAFEVLRNSINIDDIDNIDWEIFRKACDEDYVITSNCLMDAGVQAAYYLSHRLVHKSEDEFVTLIGAFNFRNPKAIQWASDYVANNVIQVETETREAIRVIIEEALKYGGHPYETAKLIKQYIGLTEKQMKGLFNYKNSLDTTVYTAIEIEKLVNMQFLKFIKMRAETIARTETIDAANQGQLLHWEDMASQGYLDKRFFKKKWFVYINSFTTYLATYWT